MSVAVRRCGICINGNINTRLARRHTNGGHTLGQLIGTLAGMITAFVICFIILTFGSLMPEALIPASVVADFLSWPDLELRFIIVGTVLYPSALGGQSLAALLGMGAGNSSVLMFLAWGTAGLVAGLLARGLLQGVLAAVFSAVSGAVLIWLLIFFVQTTDVSALFGTASMLILQAAFEGCIYPCIAVVIGGILGGAITRQR